MTRVDLSPKYYRENSAPQYRYAQEMKKHLSLNGDELILDVGCGDGRVTAELTEQIPKGQITGLDPSTAMIKYAQKHFPQIRFLLGSAETFHLDEKFHLITCFSAVHWFRNPKKVFQNLANHLFPRGKLLMFTYPKESDYWNLFAKTEQNPEWTSYLGSSALNTMLTSDGYATLLEECGFRIEEKIVAEKFVSYESKEALKNYVKGFITSHITLPEPLYETYLNQLADQVESVDAIPSKTLTLKARLE